ncbi:MAG: hypothetical protein ABDH25_00855 [Dictyoglomaceae bacterium]
MAFIIAASIRVPSVVLLPPEREVPRLSFKAIIIPIIPAKNELET